MVGRPLGHSQSIGDGLAGALKAVPCALEASNPNPNFSNRQGAKNAKGMRYSGGTDQDL